MQLEADSPTAEKVTEDSPKNEPVEKLEVIQRGELMNKTSLLGFTETKWYFFRTKSAENHRVPILMVKTGGALAVGTVVECRESWRLSLAWKAETWFERLVRKPSSTAS